MISFLKNFILLIVSLFIILFLIEVALQFFYPQATMEQLYKDYPAIYQPSDTLPFALKPNTKAYFRTPEFNVSISINAQGYRGKPFQFAKENQVRILAIGDSFTFGHGVNDNETYASYLEELMGNSVEVINAGYVSGYSPDTYYLYLKTFGLALKPDIILVGFFVGNDIDSPFSDDNEWVQVDEQNLPLKINSGYSVVENGYRINRYQKFRYKWPLLRNSNLFQLIMDRVEPLWSQSSFFHSHERVQPDLNAFANIYRPKYPKRTQILLQQVQRLLLEMHKLAQQHSSQLLPILIPELGQIDPKTIPNFISQPEQLDLDKPQRLLTDFFQRHQISYIDLLPILRAHSDQQTYFREDRHWTPTGHRLAAEAIADYLLREGI